AHGGAAAGLLLLDARELLADQRRAGAETLHGFRPQINANLAVDAADAPHRAHAGHGEQALGHGVIDEPAELLVAPAVGGHGIGEHVAAGDVDQRNDRRLDVGRQVDAHAVDGVAHFVLGQRAVLLDLEGEDGGRHALVDDRGHVAQVGDAGGRVLDLARDLGFQRAGARARQRHGDVDHGHGEVGELRDGKLVEGQQARGAEQDEDQDRRQRAVDRPGGEVHRVPGPGAAASVPASLTTRTRSPSPRKPAPRATTRSDSARPSCTSTMSPCGPPTSTPTSRTRPSPRTTASPGTSSTCTRPSAMRPCANMPARSAPGSGRSTYTVPVRLCTSSAGDTRRTAPSTSPAADSTRTGVPTSTRIRSVSASSARHSRRPSRIRRSSSPPAPTTCPGCTLRADTTPATGARPTVQSPCATTLPTSTSTLATRRPESSTPIDTSSHAATAPEATTSRATSCCCGVARLTVRLGVASGAALSVQADRASRLDRASSRKWIGILQRLASGRLARYQYQRADHPHRREVTAAAGRRRATERPWPAVARRAPP